MLTGSAGPCDPHLASPDYVAGTDATGNPVAPADVAGPTVALGSDNVIARQDEDGRLHGQVAVGTGGIYVGVGVNGLRDKVNPPPACGPNRRH